MFTWYCRVTGHHRYTPCANLRVSLLTFLAARARATFIPLRLGADSSLNVIHMILGVSVWALHVAILTKLVQAAFNVLKRQGQVLVREAATATTSEARSKKRQLSRQRSKLQKEKMCQSLPIPARRPLAPLALTHQRASRPGACKPRA